MPLLTLPDITPHLTRELDEIVAEYPHINRSALRTAATIEGGQVRIKIDATSRVCTMWRSEAQVKDAIQAGDPIITEDCRATLDLLFGWACEPEPRRI